MIPERPKINCGFNAGDRLKHPAKDEDGVAIHQAFFKRYLSALANRPNNPSAVLIRINNRAFVQPQFFSFFQEQPAEIKIPLRAAVAFEIKIPPAAVAQQAAEEDVGFPLAGVMFPAPHADIVIAGLVKI
ncbi:MAG: hypothetical protein JW847_05655 [Candidatus Omnitrophica bacterium]|nr:hypothetical protein [Candidatus Omnitrophota bacterium]